MAKKPSDLITIHHKKLGLEGGPVTRQALASVWESKGWREGPLPKAKTSTKTKPAEPAD